MPKITVIDADNRTVIDDSESSISSSNTLSEVHTLEAKTLEEFLSAVGCILVNETDEELEITSKHNAVTVMTRKGVFSQYSNLSNEEEKVAPQDEFHIELSATR
jgi:hypothetical protein